MASPRKGYFYKALIHSAEEGGYWAEVPSLPGCFTQGHTLDEVKAMLEEAVAFHLKCLEEEGQIPPPEEGETDVYEFRIAA